MVLARSWTYCQRPVKRTIQELLASSTLLTRGQYLPDPDVPDAAGLDFRKITVCEEGMHGLVADGCRDERYG
jgi:hypothetical protein